MNSITRKDRFVGIEIFGCEGGYFNTDFHDDKIIVANGEDWIVAKSWDGDNDFAQFSNGQEMEKMIKEWSGM